MTVFAKKGTYIWFVDFKDGQKKRGRLITNYNDFGGSVQIEGDDMPRYVTRANFKGVCDKEDTPPPDNWI